MSDNAALFGNALMYRLRFDYANRICDAYHERALSEAGIAPRLLDLVRERIRLKHFSIRTE